MTVDDTNIIEKLVDLGLNPREARLYFALLRIPEATPAELDRLSNVPRTKIYEVLGHMASKGLCSERREGGKKYYRATRPSEVKAQMLSTWGSEGEKWEQERTEKEAQQREKWENDRAKKEAEQREKWEQERSQRENDQKRRNDTADEVFEGLDDLFRVSLESDSALERVKILRSKAQIRLKYLKLMSECQSEVLSFTRSPYAVADDETRVKQWNITYDAMARGVKIRTVYLDESTDQPWLRQHISEFKSRGEEVRITDELPIKMFVFDKNDTMIALPSVPGLTGSDFTMLVVDDPGFVQACILLFESVWSKGKTSEEWLNQ